MALSGVATTAGNEPSDTPLFLKPDPQNPTLFTNEPLWREEIRAVSNFVASQLGLDPNNGRDKYNTESIFRAKLQDDACRAQTGLNRNGEKIPLIDIRAVQETMGNELKDKTTKLKSNEWVLNLWLSYVEEENITVDNQADAQSMESYASRLKSNGASKTSLHQIRQTAVVIVNLIILP